MNLTKRLFGREIGLKTYRKVDTIDSAFKEVSLSRQYLFSDINEVGAPPLALAINGGLLSVANDGGDVALIEKKLMKETNKWTAHNNAIFDVKWRQGFDNHLVTASGDKSIIIWDITKVQNYYSYESAHNGSIKSIDFKDQNVMASGSRDGLIKIWDLRCGRGSVIVIESAHLSQLPSIKSSPKGKPQKTSPLNSVTCVAFNQMTDQLYSSGANDGTIKVWDLRKCRRNRLNKTNSSPVKQLYQSSKRGSPSHGFTCLSFDRNYRLFASCSDHNIYGYLGDNSLPSITCIGAQINNFTRINTFGDNYLISGSVNGRALVWSVNPNYFDGQTNKKVTPICGLPHSDEEVTAVVSDSQWYNLYTCSDDQNVNKWSLFNDNHEIQTTIKSEIFVPKVIEIETKEKPKTSVLTPPSNVRPFCSLTNWLETSGKQHTTPSNPNPKRMRLTQSTPSNKAIMKENSYSKHKSSKRKLFNTNRKINEYFTP